MRARCAGRFPLLVLWLLKNPSDALKVPPLKASWSQDIPALASLLGLTNFMLSAEDVTPAPYNQPPFPNSGDKGLAIEWIYGNVP